MVKAGIQTYKTLQSPGKQNHFNTCKSTKIKVQIKSARTF